MKRGRGSGGGGAFRHRKIARHSRQLDLNQEVDDDNDDEDEDEDKDEYVGPQLKSMPMAFRVAKVVSAGVLSATFGISGRSDIPSDQGSHKVVIAVLDLQADLEWVCIPREKESVFLRVSSTSCSD